MATTQLEKTMGIHILNFRRALTIGLAAGTAWLAPNPRTANGAIIVAVQGPLFSLPIASVSSYALPGSTGNDINIDTTALNAFLTGNGSGFTFTSLVATSNSPGGSNAFVSLTGEVFLSNPGTHTITISAGDSSFTSPTGAITAFNTATGIFTNTGAGDTQVVTAPGVGVTLPSISFTSTGPNANSYSATTPFSPVSTSFTLGESIALNLTAGQNQFAATVQVVPEPTGTGLLLLGAAVLVRSRRRKHS